jgi:hypothetical protein
MHMYMFLTAFVHEVKYVHTYCIHSMYMTYVTPGLVQQIMSANCDKPLFIVRILTPHNGMYQLKFLRYFFSAREE